MFWERFYNLCLQKNTKPNPVAKEIGISSGIVTKWKNEDTLPNGETLLKIADYFDVSVDYLLGRENKKGIDIVASKVKDFSMENYNEKTSVLASNVESWNIKNTQEKNSIGTINENEAELLNVYRSLSPRDRHKLMTIAYEMQDKAKT